MYELYDDSGNKAEDLTEALSSATEKDGYSFIYYILSEIVENFSDFTIEQIAAA